MESLLEGIPRQQCLVFLDDILAHGSSFHSAITAQAVLQKIRAMCLKLHTINASCYRKMAFLGHRICMFFSCIAAPLYKILQKDQCFVWSEYSQKAFDTLKQALVYAPILSWHGNTDGLLRCPCSMQECMYCERREARELDLRQKVDKSDLPKPDCRELQEVDVTQWTENRRLDPDLQPQMLWVEAQQRLPWEEVAADDQFLAKGST